MDKQFDELSKSLAEGVSRREAVRKFGIGLAGALMASLGLGRATAQGKGGKNYGPLCQVDPNTGLYTGSCIDPNPQICDMAPSCPQGQKASRHLIYGYCGSPNVIVDKYAPCH